MKAAKALGLDVPLHLQQLADEVIELAMPFAAVHESPPGTFATCQLNRAMSAFKGDPEDICSDRVLPTLTRFGLRAF
jgi:hypothetical protein